MLLAGKVTLVITSCNRPHLLDKTLESFIKQNTYPIFCTYIIDDSGITDCNYDVVSKYKDILNITTIYNSHNIGQVPSIDKVYSLVETDWIFHCEEDWHFIKSGFIEKSFRVFQENPLEKIFTVYLRAHNDTNEHPIIKDTLKRGYYKMSQNFSVNTHRGLQTWGGFSFNPGLRNTAVCMELHPYYDNCSGFLYKGKKKVDEYDINEQYTIRGYYAMILDDESGHVEHIGWGKHVKCEWE